ncbi:MAG: hypothetical protein JNJ54_26010 [Myxococcaceae bacterium]|nr:hypothetical protein [Myxococcaceae bacterium]
MRRSLRIVTVVVAACFVCAAALAQTNASPSRKKRGAPDAGAPTKLDYLPATKAAPMHFREDAKAVEPAPPQAPTQQAAPPAQKK